jgi:uroporphyrinogen decarboxylase
MTNAALTGRERVQRMFARADQDRIPRYDSYWPETIRRWETEGLVGGENGALDVLGSDFHSTGVAWPAPFPGQTQVVSEDELTQITRNEWGATLRQWKYKSGTPEHIAFDCDTPDKWLKIYKPAYLDGKIRMDLNEVRRRHAEGRRAGRWVLWHCAESFEATRKLLGDEIVMMAMAGEPDWVRDVSKTYTDHLLREFEAVMALGLEFDGVFMWGDMAYNRATFCSPRMYQQLIWPDHKRIADWVHAHGMKIIYHTDGNVNRVLDLYIEAGFDCLQPLETKAGMDLRNLAPNYGDRLAFMGNIDVMTMLENDRAKIEAEIVAKFAAGKATRGYAYHSDHSIPPHVTFETYKYIVSLVDRYGQY